MCFERRRVEVNYNIWFACVCPRQTINQFASKQCCDKLVRSIKACPAPSPTISFWPTQLFQYVWDCERVPRWILFYWKSGVTQFSRLVTFHNRGGTQTLCLWQTHIREALTKKKNVFFWALPEFPPPPPPPPNLGNLYHFLWTSKTTF